MTNPEMPSVIVASVTEVCVDSFWWPMLETEKNHPLLNREPQTGSRARDKGLGLSSDSGPSLEPPEPHQAPRSSGKLCFLGGGGEGSSPFPRGTAISVPWE